MKDRIDSMSKEFKGTLDIIMQGLRAHVSDSLRRAMIAEGITTLHGTTVKKVHGVIFVDTADGHRLVAHQPILEKANNIFRVTQDIELYSKGRI